jgi:aminotransferase
MLELSRRASVTQSEIRIMSVECERAGGINLAQGVCDTETPLPVRRAAQKAIESGLNSYTRLDGIGELRRAIAAKMRAYNGIDADPESGIVVTLGSTGAFYCACTALLDRGDEAILFEPYYGYHVNTLAALDAVPAYVTLRPPRWQFSRADLERATTKRTRAIVVNTPANPSGKVFTREELQVISEFATAHDLFVFTDEIYEYFLYEGRKHVSIASLPGMAERTITISGLSKTFSITGWRIGYAVCSSRWSGAIGYFNDLLYVCAPSPLQHGVAAGLEELGSGFYAGLVEEYGRKRQMLCDALQQVGLPPVVPEGAYYVLADASRLPGGTSKEKAMYLLRETGVAAVPGDAFYHDQAGQNLLRFCFAKTDRELAQACKGLEKLSATVAER